MSKRRLRKAGQAKRALSRTGAGFVGLLAVALDASSEVAGTAPKDKVEVLDGATGRPEPRAEAGPRGFSKLDRSERGIATKLRIRNARDDARAPGVGKTVYRIA